MIHMAAWEKVPPKEELLFFFLDARRAGSFGIHLFTLLRCEGSIFPCLQRCRWRVFSIDGKGSGVGWIMPAAFGWSNDGCNFAFSWISSRRVACFCCLGRRLVLSPGSFLLLNVTHVDPTACGVCLCCVELKWMFRCCMFVHVVTRFVLMCDVSLAFAEDSLVSTDGRTFRLLSCLVSHTFLRPSRYFFVSFVLRTCDATGFYGTVFRRPVSQFHVSYDPFLRVVFVASRLDVSTRPPSCHHDRFPRPPRVRRSMLVATCTMDGFGLWIRPFHLACVDRRGSSCHPLLSSRCTCSLCDSSIHVWFDSSCFFFFSFLFGPHLGVDG